MSYGLCLKLTICLTLIDSHVNLCAISIYMFQRLAAKFIPRFCESKDRRSTDGMIKFETEKNQGK